MLINIVHQDAEQNLLSFAQQKGLENWGVLYFNSSQLTLKPTKEEIVLTVEPALENKSATVYYFHDGDIVIAWNDVQKNTLETLCSRLYESFGLIERNLHKYYDLSTDGEALRAWCRHKIESFTKVADTDADSIFTFAISPEQTRVFREAVYSRNYREKPEILVVEDQLFSARLLSGLLTMRYKAYVTDHVKKAWAIYLEHAPDIIFLDIELPEISGHQFAAEIHKLDPQSFVVMVTGNNYPEDVVRAKENGARAFIVKPYNKQKIMDAIENFMLERKARHTKKDAHGSR